MTANTLLAQKNGDYNATTSTTAGCSTTSNTLSITTTQGNLNYIVNQTITAENIKTQTDLNGLTSDNDQEEISYFDGLARPMQSVQHQGSPLKNDIIQPVAYDGFNRENIKYIPYAVTMGGGSYHTSALTEQADYYQTNFSDNKGYAEAMYDNSPLNKVTEQGAPGTPWQVIKDANLNSTGTGHTQRIVYGTNIANDVYLWTCDETNKRPGTMTGTMYYDVNTLYRTRVYNENAASRTDASNWTDEFKDKDEKVVLKRTYDGTNVLNTYYVYDDLGLLRYVIPPATNISTSGSDKVVLQADLNKYGYIYKYDGKNRMVQKKLPGADSVLMVYDRRDRLVATQDGVQRANSLWDFTKYDELNWPILTGTISLSSTRIALQTLVNSFNDTNLYEGRTNTATNHYYTDNSFPNSIYTKTYLTVGYYDDYDCNYDASHLADYTYTNETGYTNAPFSRLRNKPTVAKVRQLDPASGTEVWIISATFYDKHYRPVQTQTIGIQGGSERMTMEYNFPGLLLKSKQVQKVIQGTTTLKDSVMIRDEYDHMGRLLKTYHQVNTDPEVILASMQYNEMGQLVTKKLNEVSGTGKQKLDYTYNIRGWLKKINEPDLSGTDGDLFGMELMYNEGMSALNGLAQYNGNISGMKWKSVSPSNILKGYGYTYDALNRLTASKYAEGNSLNINVDKYNESMTYEKNGNILTLLRRRQPGTGALINLDNLTYNYNGNGNQVWAIGDAVADSLGRGDFYDGTDGNATHEYYYDKNGNMWLDRNKMIKIEYNMLNLPMRVTDTTNITRKIEYVYLAGGQKIKERKVNGQTVLYWGNMVYTLDGTANGITIQYIITPEGRVIKPSGSFVYEYYIRDHLGNTRVAFDVTGGTVSVVQQDDYYPFGMTYKPQSVNNDNKYLYNGKELQDESLGGVNLDWYDYGKRFYDPQIGRWNVVDPKAEKYYSLSSYEYCANNPTRFIDPNGKEIWIYYNDDNGKKQRMLYTVGMGYKGKDEFISKTVSYLNAINDNGGSKMMSDLTGSSNSFNFKNQFPTKDGEVKKGALSFKENKSGGGDIFAAQLVAKNSSDYSNLESTAHELFHGLQYENGQGGASIFNEVESNVYSGIISSKWAANTSYVGPGSLNGLGNSTSSGNAYQRAFNNLSHGYSNNDMIDAVKNFVSGAARNTSEDYNNYPLFQNNQQKSILEQYYPSSK